MKRIQKVLGILLTVALATTSFVGCSSGSSNTSSSSTSTSTDSSKTSETTNKDTSSAPVETKQEEVKLKWVVWDKDSTAYLQPAIDAYKQIKPNVTIELLDVSSQEYQDKLSVMLSGGADDIDIVTVKDTPGYSSMVNKKQLEPLDSYIEKDNIDLSVYSGLTDQIKMDDKIYELPFRSDFWVLYYNKNLFDQAGVAYPSNDITWNEYAELAKSLASGSGADRVYGSHHHTWRSTVQLGAILDGENSIIQEDYSFLQPMYDMILQMQKDKTIMDYASLKAGSIHYKGVFFNEQAAMLPMGSWFISTLISGIESGEADSTNWGIVKYPHPEGVEAGTTLGTITSLAINSASKQKEETWEFIKFFCGEEGANVIAQTGTLPAIKTDEVVATIANMKGFPTDENSKEALKVAKTYLEMPVNEKSSTIEQILNEEHDLIMTDSIAVDAGLKEMGKRVTEELNK